MKVEFILLLLLLVWWIIFNRYTKWRLELGIDFCARSEELIGIYNDYKNLESQNGTFELGQRYFVAEYNSEEIKEFFMQMEYALAVMFDQYDVIEKMEYDFAEEDWNYIQEQHQKLQNIENNLRYEKWVHGLANN